MISIGERSTVERTHAIVWNAGKWMEYIMSDSKRWTSSDRYGNEIYLTQERWEHIVDPVNHPEMLDFEARLRETIRAGRRKQDPLNPRKYRYSKAFDDLDADNTHIVAIVLFRFVERRSGEISPNNCIVTAYQKEIG